jgi:hypothetical protein
MTALQIFFNSLRSRTIMRAIWMPVLIGILLIGACIPLKHHAAPAKPPQVMQPKATPSSKAISRQRALGAGKTKSHPPSLDRHSVCPKRMPPCGTHWP